MDPYVLRADGRDVYQPEQRLIYYSNGRSFKLGEGNRRAARLNDDVDKVGMKVAQAPGMSQDELLKALRPMKKDRAHEAIREAEKRAEIRIEKEGRKHVHHPGDPDRFRATTVGDAGDDDDGEDA